MPLMSEAREPRLIDVCLHVNASDPDDVAFWATLFEVTAHEVAYAVRCVGADAGAVERFIRFTTSERLAANVL